MSVSRSDQADVTRQRFFIVRVMKTATTTLLGHARNNFVGSRDVYPTGGIDSAPGDIQSVSSIPHLLSLPAERHAEIRVYIGHFPYIAYQMLGRECTTATILREPVARVTSHLRQARRVPRFKDHSPEAIYEDQLFRERFLHNHQAKYFAMTSRDPLDGILDTIEIDDRRLELARVTLGQVDVVGLTERYDEFLGELQARFHWKIEASLATNVSTDRWEPSAALRRKIQADNLADIEFYEYARNLVRRRRTRAWVAEVAIR